MRAKLVNDLLTFKQLYNSAPTEIKNYLNKCKITPQGAEWHPEAPDEEVPHNVLAHINIVFNRARRTGDINFMLAAFFHDLGKADTTHPHPSGEPGRWSAKMHEIVSARLVEKYRDWIEELGGNYDLIHYIVAQHMRAKQEDIMRPVKQAELRKHPYYNAVKTFSEFDDMKKDWSNDLDD